MTGRGGGVREGSEVMLMCSRACRRSEGRVQRSRGMNGRVEMRKIRATGAEGGLRSGVQASEVGKVEAAKDETILHGTATCAGRFSREFGRAVRNGVSGLQAHASRLQWLR
nr:hypothetical protein CFP56_00805 [Quercus suber]